jgi:hypothetical protein
MTRRSQNVLRLRFGSLPLPGRGFSTLWGCMGHAYHDAQALRTHIITQQVPQRHLSNDLLTIYAPPSDQ